MTLTALGIFLVGVAVGTGLGVVGLILWISAYAKGFAACDQDYAKILAAVRARNDTDQAGDQ